MISTSDWKIQIFKEKMLYNFLYSSMTITPNWTGSRLLENRHLELSKHIRFEEDEAWKGLQTVLQRSDQKSKKYKIG